jgi:hypothetical protein
MLASILLLEFQLLHFMSNASKTDSSAEGASSLKSSFSPVTDKAPKFHQVVEAKAPGEKPVKAVRKPEAWYDPDTGRPLGFEPKDFKPA